MVDSYVYELERNTFQRRSLSKEKRMEIETMLLSS